MKRLLVLFLIIMSLSLPGCGSKNSEKASADNTQTSENQTQTSEDQTSQSDDENDNSEATPDYTQYAGKYLCVELINSDGSDVSDQLKSQWEDKSHYSYYEITEDGEVTLVNIDEGEKTEIPFGPLTVTPSDGDAVILSFTGETYTLEGGKMITEYESGARTVWMKTDEISE